ncbi:centrosomal protein 15-like [Acropora palmata]|uniref:centrosomal protein 15-like n=1 Tax=Acropora palmata TaxID=6131 RepID=UPI003DA16407
MVMDDHLIRTKWLAREAQLSQQHEEILAKREMLLAANESRMVASQQNFQSTLHGFQIIETRNDQLIKELDGLQSRLKKKAEPSFDCDVKLIGLQASYWKMVEEEFPKWIERTKTSNKGTGQVLINT